MNYFQIKLGLGASQSQIIDRLKSAGAEVIQTSDGLCVKSDQTMSDIQKTIAGEASGATVETLNKESLAADADAPTDLKAFVGV